MLIVQELAAPYYRLSVYFWHFDTHLSMTLVVLIYTHCRLQDRAAVEG